jgi:hypothetical protein
MFGSRRFQKNLQQFKRRARLCGESFVALDFGKRLRIALNPGLYRLDDFLRPLRACKAVGKRPKLSKSFR